MIGRPKNENRASGVRGEGEKMKIGKKEKLVKLGKLK